MFMITRNSLMDELKAKGNEKTRATYVRHGMPLERTLGVSVADLKVVAKRIKGQQDVACQLYETGFMEAMYLAGLVADGKQMTRKQLQAWADGAAGMPMISEYTVPWVTIENAHGLELAREWIKSKKEHVASSGWCSFSGLVATREDGELDLGEIEKLLGTVVKEIKGAKNRVRYTMNGFVIAVGSYVKPLLAEAKAAAKKIDVVNVDVGETACKVPAASDYIAKMEAAQKIGKKKKTIRC
jgi:3-methyladenine DNA glycosylase AlkD